VPAFVVLGLAYFGLLDLHLPVLDLILHNNLHVIFLYSHHLSFVPDDAVV
jgi:hypothetical protein